MSQLINRGINTVKYTNAVLRNLKQLGNPNFIFLRSDKYNLPDFSKLSIFKDLALDLARQMDADTITDIAIVMTHVGQENILDAVENRIILVLDNEASFENDGNRYTPVTGDLIWTNQKITINNNSSNVSMILVIDLEEFLL